jgi:hypothetical protein
LAENRDTPAQIVIPNRLPASRGKSFFGGEKCALDHGIIVYINGLINIEGAGQQRNFRGRQRNGSGIEQYRNLPDLLP